MIREFKIRGFKSVSELDIEFGVVNCFIGANGVGKSNVLEAVGVLGAAANGTVDDEALLRRGVRPGLPRLFKSSFKNFRSLPHIGLEAIDRTGATYRVSLLNPLNSPEPAWSFKTETLTDGAQAVVTEGVRSRGNLNPRAGLAAVSMATLSADSPATHLMQQLQQYAIYCPNTPTLRGLVPDPQTREPLGLAGGRLAEAVADLRQWSNGAQNDVIDDLLGLVDWAVDVSASRSVQALLSPSVSRSQEVLKFEDRFMASNRNELTAFDASEGVLYVLFTAALCLSGRGPRLFAIDNLDQALNPRLVTALTSRLASWLGSSTTPRQMMFTAHNPAVLDGLDLDNDDVRLFAVDRDSNGHTVVRRLVLTPQLKALNCDFPLSRLWMMGHLGAVPNV
ncbi:AAA family ATPase [Pinisolibacter aquiterrae]|uniref:AAA family ATPase n=1 Tax=Pinisolibacter aquiterrae TaxID=2815579 RepID=UPI001C3CE37B|nr:AAA family ATPase [Pinisolibacter aquiterrae]MBV5262987.1 AAA family ATPase [Pinisolibacter aquiterrae]MCC8235327.1 AAA family ATPase [Pinisolibacter aquiterrae]